MQAKFLQEGKAIDHTPVAAVAAGQVVVIGGMVAIAKLDIEAGRLGALHIGGIFDVVHAADEIGDGVAVYWDADGNPVGGVAGTGCATATANGNTFMGFAHGAVDAQATTVKVIHWGSAAVTSNHYGPLNNVIADPGNAGAIPVTASGYVELVTAGAETRTIAAPTVVGQQLLLIAKTLVGACTVTIATGIDAQGSTVLAFATAGSMALLQAKSSGANLRWSLIASDGLTKVLGAVTVKNVNVDSGASTAAAGSTYEDAGALPAGTGAVYPVTAADDTTGVIVNAADKVTKRMLYIANLVSNKVLKVYGPAGASINGAAANTAFSSVSGKGVIMYCLDATANTWAAW